MAIRPKLDHLPQIRFRSGSGVDHNSFFPSLCSFSSGSDVKSPERLAGPFNSLPPQPNGRQIARLWASYRYRADVDSGNQSLVSCLHSADMIVLASKLQQLSLPVTRLLSSSHNGVYLLLVINSYRRSHPIPAWFSLYHACIIWDSSGHFVLLLLLYCMSSASKVHITCYMLLDIYNMLYKLCIVAC